GIDIDAAGHLQWLAPAQMKAAGGIAARADQNMTVAGALHSNQRIALAAGDALAMDGSVSVATDQLTLQAGGNLSVGETGSAIATGPLSIDRAGFMGVNLIAAQDLRV